jgi:GTP-binding protein
VEVAIQEADLILFLMDGKEGLNPTDIDVAGYLRKVAKPVFYVVNKIDGERQEGGVMDFYRLGVSPLYSISAVHGRGIGDLMDEVLKAFPSTIPEKEKVEQETRVALVGRPNVGKSSLLNRLIGRPRVIVDSTPGTTRDAIDTPFLREGRKYIFIDTAGIRRKGKVGRRLEKYSAIKALKSLERCDVALILLDGFEGLTEQDARIAEFAEESGRAMILLVNKWDLVHKDTGTMERYQERIRRELKTLDYVPILFISALTGQRTSKIFEAIDQATAEHRKRVTTGELNQWLQDAVVRYAPPLYRNRQVKLFYISQVGVAPPTFILFTNEPQGLAESYQRYLIRRLREKYGFTGSPIRLYLRRRRKEIDKNPK